MGLDNPVHLAFIVVILLLVFGARRLPEIGRSLGSGMREFKDSISGESKQTPALTPAAQQPAAAHQAPVAQPPMVQPQPPVAQPPAAQPQQPVAQPPTAQPQQPVAQPPTAQPQQPVAQPFAPPAPQQPAAPASQDESAFGRQS